MTAAELLVALAIILTLSGLGATATQSTIDGVSDMACTRTVEQVRKAQILHHLEGSGFLPFALTTPPKDSPEHTFSNWGPAGELGLRGRPLENTRLRVSATEGGFEVVAMCDPDEDGRFARVVASDLQHAVVDRVETP